MALPNLPPSSTSQPHTSGKSITALTASVTRQDFANRVFLLLSQQDQYTIRQHLVPNATDVDTVVQQALAAIRQKQAICQAKRWTFKLRGHTVVLRDEADNVVKWLDRFKQVGDVVSNFDPVHAGLPWAGIRLLLEVSVAKGVNDITAIVEIPY